MSNKTTASSELDAELGVVKTSLQLATNALERIYNCSGPYNNNPLRRAENCILEIKTSALEALVELRKRDIENSTDVARHSHTGNCWDNVPVRDGNIVDVCEAHDEPRGRCSVCPGCQICGEEPDSV